MTNELRRLAEAATPGPWRAWFSSTTFTVGTAEQEAHPLNTHVAKGSWWTGGDPECPNEARAKSNAAFIAAASPAVVLALLDEHDEAREAVKRLAGALERIDDNEYRYGQCWMAETAREALADPVVKHIVEGGR